MLRFACCQAPAPSPLITNSSVVSMLDKGQPPAVMTQTAHTLQGAP